MKFQEDKRLNSNRKKLVKVMKALQNRRSGSKNNNKVVRYYGPYIDSSGEKFYLPKEWRQSLSGRGKSKTATRHWQESKINYSLDDEMN